MQEPVWLTLSQAVENWATATAIVLGGFWALYRFVIQRSRETALELDLSTQCMRQGGDYFLVFFDVTCHNKGSVRVAATKRKNPAFDDNRRGNGEVIRYGLDLKIRNFAEGPLPSNRLDWWAAPNSGQWGPVDEELDLLADYEVPRTKKTHFWIEPGESAHLSSALLLPAGHYLAKATFIGRHPKKEFWTRLFLLTIPTEGQATRHLGMASASA